MFNKYNKIIVGGLLVLTLPLLVGCTKEEKNTNIVTTTTKKSERKEEKIDNYKLVYEGVDITPGRKLDYKDINKEPKISTIPSCAFSGEDHVYTYDDIEITCSIADDKSETVYSVYFINETYSMPSGLKKGSKVEDMKSILGEPFDEFNGIYYYKGNNITIKIETQDDKIFAIEYTLNT